LPFLALSLAALGVNVLTGYTGQVSLGSAAFLAIGAFGAYNLDLRIPGLPLLVTIVAAGLIAAAGGLVFVFPACACEASISLSRRWRRSSSCSGC